MKNMLVMPELLQQNLIIVGSNSLLATPAVDQQKRRLVFILPILLNLKT